jgi:hypothetical protein
MASFNIPSYSARTINDFKSRLAGGGARPNLFECEINFPTGAVPLDQELNQDLRFFVKSASLPASTISSIPVPFRGRTLQIAGDRTFDPWTITVINDTNFRVRNAFEKWMNFINRHDDNAGVITPAAYQKEMVVHQLSRGTSNQGVIGALPSSSDTLKRLKSYVFYGTFPTSISDITLSYDSSDTIEEFTVDLQVQWWDALDETGSSILGTSTDAAPGSISNADIASQFTTGANG